MDKYFEKVRMSLSRVHVRFLSWMENAHGSASDSVNNWHNSRLHNLNRRTLVILVFGIVFISAVYIEGFQAPTDFPTEQYITIEEGENVTSLSQILEELNIVRSASLLKTIVVLRGGQRSVHAGDYSFAKPVGAFAVARIITTGAYGLEPIRITIPEGATVADMAVIYAKRLFKFDPENFFAEAVSMEGFLYPDTYHFLPNVEEEEVITVMRDNFNANIAEFVADIEESEYNLSEIITLASIIEK
ncbi:MAG: endolytic transglycosylase MltG, partial [Candidatus Pacebacteria bacterium]|nr:endolytic transglycosylase MltG [Candidatus Paceibacterota bacterium]